jgi:hypothetical protein
LRPGDQLYLVIEKLSAEAAVDAIYELYLDLPNGATPSRTDPHYVADLNFFDAESGRRGASFNITEMVATLQSKGALRDGATITLIPNGHPSAAARPSIGKIAIVAGTR